MAIETGVIIMFVALGYFCTKIIYRWNKFAGNMGLLLTGVGLFFYFVQADQTLFGFGGLFIALIGIIRMIYDLFK